MALGLVTIYRNWRHVCQSCRIGTGPLFRIAGSRGLAPDPHPDDDQQHHASDVDCERDLGRRVRHGTVVAQGIQQVDDHGSGTSSSGSSGGGMSGADGGGAGRARLGGTGVTSTTCAGTSSDGGRARGS